jgi:aminoglycoside/choline kinase family phosphotransferase
MPMPAELRERLLSFVRAFAGGSLAEITTVVGDASARRYYRVRTGGAPASTVVMELPSDAPPPVSPGVGPAGPSFLAMQGYLEAGGFPVPRVFRADLGLGLIALEDLGDLTLEAAVRALEPAQRRALYARAVTLVADLQRVGADRPDPACLAFQRRFDEAVLRWELAHFQEWLLEKDRGVHPSGAEARALDEGFGWLARTLADSPQVLVHRDFQSRNIMVVPAATGPAELKVIDFQDALLGSQAYDLVALLRDSYVELPPAEVVELLAIFAAAAGVVSQDYLRKLFHMQTVQRKLKDAGRFVFLDRARGNPSYLRWIPSSLRYVAEALPQVPELGPVAEVLRRHVPELRLSA